MIKFDSVEVIEKVQSIKFNPNPDGNNSYRLNETTQKAFEYLEKNIGKWVKFSFSEIILARNFQSVIYHHKKRYRLNLKSKLRNNTLYLKKEKEVQDGNAE